MKNNRIYINGTYNEDNTLNAIVTKITFTGEGSDDFSKEYINTGIREFEGIEEMGEMTDEQFDNLETKIAESFKTEFCKEGEDFDYFVE